MRHAVAAAMATAFLLTSCSLSEAPGEFEGSSEEREPVRDLDQPASVNASAWTWDAPEGVADLDGLFPVPGGVAALVDDGVVGLSGENGGVMWEHRVAGSEVFGAVAGQGRYFVLQILDPDDDEAPPRMVVLDLSTGEPVWDYQLGSGDSASGVVRGWLGNVTDEYWVTVAEGEELLAHRLGDDEEAWSVPDVADCDDVGSVDGTVMTDDVLVTAFTCYEQPEGESPVEMTEGQEFVSGFVGFAPSTGDELWRTEVSVGMFPGDAHERELTLHDSGLVTAYYPYSQIGQIVDPSTGEVRTLDEGGVLWSNEDGSLVGVWDERTRSYWTEEPGGSVRERLGDSDAGATESIINALRGDIETVGLEGGVLHMAESIPGGAGETELAVFEGFEETVPVTFTWDEESPLEVDEVRAVPGAVAVSFIDPAGRSGVIGLQ
ncbi:PQQ-binding-like beta-propeller repeat protein [Nocardiopsis sp. FIRDI 009]|uniref:outer membrane protein assembly factor BamB family protein n=1 Tax=Nocardiopsis sp. FIRDI 009 TaxID=714197 RepID=UPI000E229688|nr:PQQ-binding-like beta-propeller repeat protein [Nocardiopsis sp. FIRDI 009]